MKNRMFEPINENLRLKLSEKLGHTVTWKEFCQYYGLDYYNFISARSFHKKWEKAVEKDLQELAKEREK